MNKTTHIECIKCEKLLGYTGGPIDGSLAVEPCDCQNQPKMLFKPPQPVEEPITTCWYKYNDEWRCGFFHQWSMDHEEFETGPGNIPVAIIEDAKDCQVHVIYAGKVSFNPDDPNEALTKAAEDYKSIKFDSRFQPQLRQLPSGWAVRVDPDVIEIFNHSRQYVCQVKWVNGRVECPPGGLPKDELEQMFREVNE